MKKYMILLLASLAFTFVACDNDTEPGGTAVEKMAGDWWETQGIPGLQDKALPDDLLDDFKQMAAAEEAEA